MACPDENTVVEFVQGNLSEQVSREVEEHLDTCRTCRRLLAQLAKASIAISSHGHADVPPPEISMTSIATGADGPQVGQVLASRYHVLKLLGQGAMGTVYEVKDLQLEDKVALKLLRPELTNMPQFLQHLRHEVVLGRRISHPNVCRLHDIGQSGDKHFITMNLVEGRSLTQRMAERLPEETWAVSVLEQICEALHAAHGQGVVHRDLKSSNIMVDEQGQVTVMDFGLAKDLWGEPSQSGMLIGSPAYWSPEQACGQRASERSDIYSLGVVACELFGARQANLGPLELGKVPRRYRKVVQRCLMQRPEERFDSAMAVKTALRHAAQAPAIPRVGVLVLAAAALVICASALLVYHFVIRDQSDRQLSAGGSEQPRAMAHAVPRVQPIDGSAEVVRPDAEAVATVEPKPRASRRSRKRRHRSSRRPSRRTRKVEPAPPPPVPPPTKAVEPPKPDLGPLKARLKALERDRSRRGILLADLPQYRVALLEASRSLRAEDQARMKAALDQLKGILAKTRIDKAFIAKKLGRLNRLRGSKKLDPPTAQRLSRAFQKVHASYFAGKYEEANNHLNRIWRILRPSDS